MACGGQTKNITYTSNALSTRFQRRPAWYKLSPRSISTFLSNSYRVHGKHNVLHIQRSDKIIILLRFNNTFTIYRKRDEAVAVLKNVTFKQPDPPVVFEISQLAESIDGIQMVLMYAVALKDWTHDTEIKFNEGDLVLILADIGQEEYVGITEQKQMSVRQMNYGSVGNYGEAPYEDLPFVENYSCPEKPLPLPPIPASKPPTVTTESKESQSATAKRMNSPPPPIPASRTPEGNGSQFEVKQKMDSPPIATSRVSNVTAEGSDVQSDAKQEILLYDWDDEYLTPDLPYESYQTDSQGDHWFKRRMSRCSAEQLLTNEGDYLFRYKDDSSNAIVLSQCIGENQYRHSVVMPESSNERIFERTPEVEERILQFAKSEGLLNEDDKPIRLGGTRPEEKIYYDYASISSDTPLLKVEGVDDDEAITPDKDGYYSEILQENEYHEYQQYQSALTYLLEKGCMVVPKDLHENVADHLIEEKWDEFGKHLKVPPNTRRRIEREVSDTLTRTTKLLDVWHERRGEDATLKELVDALLKLNLEEITSLLEDLRGNLIVEDSS